MIDEALTVYCRCYKFSNTRWLPKRPGQTVLTQIRLLLKKQSDMGPPFLLLWIPALIANILFDIQKEKCLYF